MEKPIESPINLFKTPAGRARYFADYDAALNLWHVPVESHFVSTEYGQTHVISCGPPDAHPLVLLHGGQASSTMWFANAPDLSLKYHVIALDTTGELGKSVPTRHNATRLDLAAWLEGVLDALGIESTHMMGLSRGGWLTLNLALQAPGRLEKIVLLSPASSFIPLNPFFSAVAGAVIRLPTRFVARTALQQWTAPGFVVDPIYAEQFVTGLLTWNWAVNKSGYSGVMPSTFSDDELGQVRQPVLMLIGDHDRLNPPSALERARRLIPQLQGEIIPQAGHMLSMEQPALVDSRVLEFLAG